MLCSSSKTHFHAIVEEIFACNLWGLRRPINISKNNKGYFCHQFVINVGKGFPSMFDSLDYMHYGWEKCFTTWKGLKEFHNSWNHFDKSLWIWHWFFGLPSGNTYLNVLNKSLGEWCWVCLDIICWWMAFNPYGTYLSQPFMNLNERRAKQQEACGKKIEWCFRVL